MTTYQEHYKATKATQHNKAYWTVDNMKKAGAAYIDAIRIVRDVVKHDGIDGLRVTVSPGNVKTGALPNNLKLLFSGWTGLTPDNPHDLPETTVYGSEGPRGKLVALRRELLGVLLSRHRLLESGKRRNDCI